VEFKHVTGIGLLLQVEVATFERLQTVYTVSDPHLTAEMKKMAVFISKLQKFPA